PPLAGGAHEASFSARFAGEGASRARKLRFQVKKAPARLQLALSGAPLAPERDVVALCTRVLDRDELPVADSLAVRITCEPRGLFRPSDTTITAWGGEAWAYLRRARGVTTKAASRAVLVARLARPVPVRGVALVPAARVAVAGAGERVRTGFAASYPAD